MKLYWACFLLLAPVRAHADLEFIQVIQAQSDRGKDGLFGKSWVEVRGRKMRMVSGYARKIQEDAASPEPRRVIQLLDVDAGERLLLDPESKTYSKAPVSTMDYGNRMAGVLRKGGHLWGISRPRITLMKKAYARELLGAQCQHYHLRADFTLTSPKGRVEQARLDQHVWVAPLTGALAGALMDLIAFENAYRERAGGNLSPLDHERYQLREAAAYLQVTESGLRDVVEQVREKLRDLPSYPVASSVSWYRKTAPKPPVSLGTVKKPRPPEKPAKSAFSRPEHPPREANRKNRWPVERGYSRPKFKIIQWHSAEKQINNMYRRARGRFPMRLQPPRPSMVKRGRRGSEQQEEHPPEPNVYPRFEEELQKILSELVESEETEIGRQAPDESGGAGVPFYEIYAELHGLGNKAVISAADMELPKDFTRVPYRPGEHPGGSE